MVTPAPQTLKLRAGDLALDLVPETGGGIACFRMGAIDLMRSASPAELAARNPRQLASFPLFPYSNRVVNGRFIFDSQIYPLALNSPPHPHTLHGNSWQRPWKVEVQRLTYAHLVFDHDPARDGREAWPFAYRAAQVFRLDANLLELTMTLRNQDTRPMPAGFGLHPYFPRTPDVRLTAQASGVWRNSADMMPVEHTPVPPEWDFSRGAAISSVSVDNCFTGFGGKALIEWPGRHRGLSIEASPEFRNLVVFVPPKQDFFCCEPVSNVNDGFNKLARKEPDTGVVVLQPGETLAGTVRFRVTKA
jgi:aldose 1-epimerase